MFKNLGFGDLNFKNRIYLGVIAGVAATIAKDILNQGLYSLKIIKTLFAQYAIGMYVSLLEAKSLPGIIAGYFVDFGLSALLGIIFIFILEKTKSKHIVFQGFVFGSALFLGIYGALLAMGISSVKERGLIDVVLMILCHLTYGLTLGLFVRQFGKNALTLSAVNVRSNVGGRE
jgi:hypothetical protein